MTTYKDITVVDETGENPRPMSYEEATENNHSKLGVTVFLVDDKGNIFLQKRSENVGIFPGMWSTSAGGHVTFGDTPLQAAKKELQEELGLVRDDLTHVGKLCVQADVKGRTIRSWNEVFMVPYHGEEFHCGEEEVTAGEWFPILEVAKRVEADDPDITPALKQSWYLVEENYNIHEGYIYTDILVCDEDGNNVRGARFDDALRKGLIRMGSEVFLVNDKNEIYFQKRSEHVKIFPGRFSASAGGHVSEGETFEENAVLELEEEAGVTGVPLVHIDMVLSNEGGHPPRRTLNKVYLVQCNNYTKSDGDWEIAGGEWHSFEEVEQLMKDDPDRFTPPVQDAWPAIKLNFDQSRGMIYENIIVSDENDENAFATRFSMAIKNEWIRRCVNIHLVNKETREIFLQQRNLTTLIDPGRWDISAAGHVDEGHTIEETARKELHEELGIQTDALRPIGKKLLEYHSNGYFFRVWDNHFVVEYTGETISINQDEVHDGAWFKIDTLEKEMKEHPEKFAAPISEKWDFLKEHLLE